MNRRWLFGLLFLLAVVVRFHDPTFRSLWGDEIHSVYRALHYDNIQILKESHLPVYFVLLSYWIKLFGLGEYVLRLLSIIIGIMVVPIFIYYSNKLLGEKSALYGGLLMALSPLAIMHSQEIRVYGLALLFSVISGFTLWEILDGKRNRQNYTAYSLATLLLLLTHVYGVLLITAQIIYLIFYTLDEKPKPALRPIIFILLAVGIIVSPFYLFLVGNNVMTAVSGSADMAFAVFPAYLKFFLIYFVLSLGETMAPWNWPVVIPVGLVFGYLFIKSFESFQDRKIIYLLALSIVPVIIASLFLRPTMPKYLIVALPFYMLIIGDSLKKTKNQYWRIIMLLILVAGSLLSVNNYFNLREYHNANQIEPWRKVADYIKENYKSGDIILTTNNFVPYKLVNYYLNQLSDEGRYPVYTLQDENYTAEAAAAGSHPIYRVGGKEYIDQLKVGRVWLVGHISDDRNFPSSYLAKVRNEIKKSYNLVWEKSYIPYEETLVAKLPIGRHKAGQSRIIVDLYDKIEAGN